MNKFQDFDFRNVNDFLDYLPDKDLKIVERLRELIFDCIPDVQEKLAYNVPFYSRHSRICFVWPGVIYWGSTRREGVDLGFCKGNFLPDPSYLEIGNRKQIYVKTFLNTKEIDSERLRQLLYEAVMIDEALHNGKAKSKRKPSK